MRWPVRLSILVAALAGLSVSGAGVTVRIENPVGNVTARVAPRDTIEVRRTSPVRPARTEDTSVEQLTGLIAIKVNPADGARVDLEVEIPYGFELEASTVSGAIALNGMFRRAELITQTGDLLLSVPWPATRLRLTAKEEPKQVSIPDTFKVSRETVHAADGGTRWLLSDKWSDLRIVFGRIVAEADAPGRVVLGDIPIPDDSPVKLPWQAPGIVEAILADKKSSRAPPPKPVPNPQPEGGSTPITVDEGIPVFSSSVRLVNLTAAVFDSEGHPVTDLKPEDFEVLEDGVTQNVTYAGSEEVPFNLALLLDLSGSTRRDRPAMKEAAIRFVGIARPQDKVAAYALASNMFHVVSPLTSDRDHLRNLIESIPQVSGGTPLYDVIVLAYAQELRQLPQERNALIVISDGIDNRIHGTGTDSEVSFGKLRKAAESMNALIYPIFLDPFTKIPPPGWAKKARENMQALADATGGRLFVAQSVHDLDPVYPLVADELRSVYTLAYYPKNQDFDGSWRQIQVRVKRPGARVRTRTGYIGR